MSASRVRIVCQDRRGVEEPLGGVQLLDLVNKQHSRLVTVLGDLVAHIANMLSSCCADEGKVKAVPYGYAGHE